MSELRILVSKKEIDGLPSDIYKILLSEEPNIVINPKERKYVVGKSFKLKIEDKSLQIYPDGEIKINGYLFRMNGNDVKYILITNGDVFSEDYSSLEIFKKKYGFTEINGQYPKS